MSSISIKEYFSREGSIFSHSDAKKIGPVLHEMAQDGGVTARDVVDAARSKNSPLHEYFEWNDRVAADMFRLDQARVMMRAIRVRIVHDGEERVVRPFQVQRTSGWDNEPRRYHTFQVMHGDSAFAAQMMDSAIDDLLNWRRKYEPYVEIWRGFGDVFQGVINQIGEFEEDFRADNIAGETDEALVKLLAWRAECSDALDTWTAAREQMEFMFRAIADAEGVFAKISETKTRDCMRCGKPFKSVHSGNRICKSCLNLKTVNEQNGEALDATVSGS